MLTQEREPEQILMMTQLSDSQIYILKYQGRKLKVGLICSANSFCENQHYLLVFVIHCKNSECRLLLDDLPIPAARFTCWQVIDRTGSYFFPLKALIWSLDMTAKTLSLLETKRICLKSEQGLKDKRDLKTTELRLWEGPHTSSFLVITARDSLQMCRIDLLPLHWLKLLRLTFCSKKYLQCEPLLHSSMLPLQHCLLSQSTQGPTALLRAACMCHSQTKAQIQFRSGHVLSKAHIFNKACSLPLPHTHTHKQTHTYSHTPVLSVRCRSGLQAHIHMSYVHY